MFVVEFGRMVGGFEFETFWVALLATERVVDLVVANEAVLHVGKVFFAERAGGGFQSAVTAFTLVLRRRKLVPQSGMIDAVGRGEVLLLIDRSGDSGGDSGNFQMQGVVEVFEDFPFAFVTEAGGVAHGRMAGEAIQLLRQGLGMRERSWAGLPGSKLRKDREKS
jgi:hypothetical protein